MSLTGRVVTWAPQTQRVYGGSLDQMLRQGRAGRVALDQDFAALEQRVLAAGGALYRIHDEVIVEMPEGEK